MICKGSHEFKDFFFLVLSTWSVCPDSKHASDGWKVYLRIFGRCKLVKWCFFSIFNCFFEETTTIFRFLAENVVPVSVGVKEFVAFACQVLRRCKVVAPPSFRPVRDDDILVKLNIILVFIVETIVEGHWLKASFFGHGSKGVSVLSKLAIESIPFEVVPALSVGGIIGIFVCTVVEDLCLACKEVHVLADEGFDKVHRLFVFKVHSCFGDLVKVGLRILDSKFFHSNEHGVHVAWAVDRWDESEAF